MKVLLKRNENGGAIGWTMEPENDTDQDTINTIRDLSFWGIGDTVVEYSGRSNGTQDKAGTLHWRQRKYDKN